MARRRRGIQIEDIPATLLRPGIIRGRGDVSPEYLAPGAAAARSGGREIIRTPRARGGQTVRTGFAPERAPISAEQLRTLGGSFIGPQTLRPSARKREGDLAALSRIEDATERVRATTMAKLTPAERLRRKAKIGPVAFRQAEEAEIRRKAGKIEAGERGELAQKRQLERIRAGRVEPVTEAGKTTLAVQDEISKRLGVQIEASAALSEADIGGRMDRLKEQIKGKADLSEQDSDQAAELIGLQMKNYAEKTRLDTAAKIDLYDRQIGAELDKAGLTGDARFGELLVGAYTKLLSQEIEANIAAKQEPDIAGSMAKIQSMAQRQQKAFAGKLAEVKGERAADLNKSGSVEPAEKRYSEIDELIKSGKVTDAVQLETLKVTQKELHEEIWPKGTGKKA